MCSISFLRHYVRGAVDYSCKRDLFIRTTHRHNLLTDIVLYCATDISSTSNAENINKKLDEINTRFIPYRTLLYLQFTSTTK